MINSNIVPWHQIDIAIVICGGISLFTALAKSSAVEPKNVLPMLRIQAQNELASAIHTAQHLPRILINESDCAKQWAKETAEAMSSLIVRDLPVFNETMVNQLHADEVNDRYSHIVRNKLCEEIRNYVEIRERVTKLESHIDTLGGIETVFIYVAPWLASIAIALALFKAINKP
jgi:hypothetical protein